MQARTERFEMRLEQDVLDRIDTWRDTRSKELERPISRSEAVRALVEVALDRGPPTLSDGDRLILVMLGDVMKHLKVRGEINPDLLSAAIYGGHLWGLEWEHQGLFHGHRDRRSTVKEVADTMEMWFRIETAFAKLSPKDKQRVTEEAGSAPEFLGYDGNYEGECMSIARFLVDHLGRFPEFKGRTLNSHCPVIDGYRRMLHVFEPMRKTLLGREMDVADLITLLQAHRNRGGGHAITR